MHEAIKEGIYDANVVERARQMYGFPASIEMSFRLDRNVEYTGFVDIVIRSTAYWTTFLLNFSKSFFYNLHHQIPDEIFVNMPPSTQ